MIKLIVFDWDDVFTLGSKEGYYRCYHEAVEAVGVHLDPAEERRRILETWSEPHKIKLGKLLKERPQLVDKACTIYEQHLFGTTFVESLRVLRGTVELLEKLRKKYVLCVATGMHPGILKERVFRRFGFPDVFSEIRSTYELNDPTLIKPHPHMLQQILAHQKIEPRQSIFVGDARDDVLMARAAGVLPVVVLSGHLNRKEAEALHVEYIVQDVTHLESVLEKINSRKIK